MECVYSVLVNSICVCVLELFWESIIVYFIKAIEMWKLNWLEQTHLNRKSVNGNTEEKFYLVKKFVENCVCKFKIAWRHKVSEHKKTLLTILCNPHKFALDLFYRKELPWCCHMILNYGGNPDIRFPESLTFECYVVGPISRSAGSKKVQLILTLWLYLDRVLVFNFFQFTLKYTYYNFVKLSFHQLNFPCCFLCLRLRVY